MMKKGGASQKEKEQRKYELYKKFYKTHHQPHGDLSGYDFASNACFVIFMLLIVGVIVTFSVVYWTHPYYYPPPPPPMQTMKRVRDHNPRLIARNERKQKTRFDCKTGEHFNSELGLCAPEFHAPLAFDGLLMNNSLTACDSFYQNMCGRWISEHTNENRAFSFAYHRNQAIIKRIVTGPPAANAWSLPPPSASSLTDFYRSCLAMDTSPKETKLEIKHMLDFVAGTLRTHADLPGVFGRLAKVGYTMPWAVSIERHPTEPRMVPFFSFDGFSKKVHENHIYQLVHDTLDITGWNIVEVQNKLQSIMRVMRVTREHNTRPLEDIADYTAYIGTQFPGDLYKFSDLPQEWSLKGHTPVPGWQLFFQALDGHALRFQQDQQVWVIGKPYLDWLFTQGIASLDVADWRAFVEFSILYNSYQFEPELPHDVYFRQHDMQGPLGPGGRLYHRLPRGNTSHTLTPEERCMRITQHMLPGLVADAFMKNHFPVNEKEQVKQDVRLLVARIVNAFRAQIRTCAWLTAEDKAAIAHKLDALIVRVAEPDEWKVEPFANQVSIDRYLHNMNMIRRYRVEQNMALWHKDTPSAFDRSALAFFAMPLTEVNAFYSPPTNTITVLAGLLQHPFYNVDYNELSKYAILGTVIGHELSHALDPNGLYWDAEGSLVLQGILQGATSMEQFYNRTDCIITDFGDISAACENVNYGNQTIGEDLSDLNGISLAYDAYFKQGDAGKAAGMGERQHFFMILAQVFCESYDLEHTCEAVASDVHAVPEMRIDRSLRNIKPFQEAFGCHTGQGMYREESKMCRVF